MELHDILTGDLEYSGGWTIIIQPEGEIDGTTPARIESTHFLRNGIPDGWLALCTNMKYMDWFHRNMEELLFHEAEYSEKDAAADFFIQEVLPEWVKREN